MKPKIQSFSFLMELIIVILFFAVSATICTSFIVMAKNKQTQATELKDQLLEAQSMIETMQAYPHKNVEDLFEVTKISENHYKKDFIEIEIVKDDVIHGTIKIQYDNEVVSELPFVLGGQEHE